MSEVQRELLERSKDWDRAIKERDVIAVADLLHDDYALVIVQPAQAIMHRDQWLGLLPDYIVSEWDIQEQIIDVDGDVAAVLQRVKMTAAVLGQDRSGTFVTSDIWRRTGAGWKVWRRHSTPMTAGQLPPREDVVPGRSTSNPER